MTVDLLAEVTLLALKRQISKQQSEKPLVEPLRGSQGLFSLHGLHFNKMSVFGVDIGSK